MKQITTAEARRHMAELLNRAAYGKERFVVTRHGRELVAIVPLEEVTLLDRQSRDLSGHLGQDIHLFLRFQRGRRHVVRVNLTKLDLRDFDRHRR